MDCGACEHGHSRPRVNKACNGSSLPPLRGRRPCRQVDLGLPGSGSRDGRPAADSRKLDLQLPDSRMPRETFLFSVPAGVPLVWSPCETRTLVLAFPCLLVQEGFPGFVWQPFSLWQCRGTGMLFFPSLDAFCRDPTSRSGDVVTSWGFGFQRLFSGEHSSACNMVHQTVLISSCAPCCRVPCNGLAGMAGGGFSERGGGQCSERAQGGHRGTRAGVFPCQR